MAHRGWGRCSRLSSAKVFSACLFFFPLTGYGGPMDLGGQFSVEQSGAAVYTIPLQIVPGVAELEPKIALTYNSQSGNGLLGVGWNLSGLGNITRCPRTVAQDGVVGGVGFDANDRFCLDGQRLIAIRGNDGADGTEYRTERESFAKVISYGVAGNGPAWFKVWTKDGRIIDYGNSSDSRIEAIKTAGSGAAWTSDTVRLWAMSRVATASGNYYAVSYTKDATSGDYYPNRIDYTGNSAGAAPGNALQFLYEARPDNAPFYLSGSRASIKNRLKAIQSYAGSSVVTEYRLSYRTGNTGRSQLSALTQCSMPANVCKAGLNIGNTDWTSNSFSTRTVWNTALATGFLGDVNGDGKSDFISQGTDGIYVALSAGTSASAASKWVGSFGTTQGYADQNVTPLFVADANSDGKADIVAIASDGVYVALSNGAGFNAASKWLSNFGSGSSFAWTNMKTYPRALADINGDGRPDIIGFRNDGVYAALNTGVSFSAPTRWIADFGTATSTVYADNDTKPRMLVNVNGDGQVDVVGFASNGVWVARSNGAGFDTAVKWSDQYGTGTNWTTQDTYPRLVGDINGDGLPDIVGFSASDVNVSINTGYEFLAPYTMSGFGTAGGYASYKANPRFVADVNGDGKDDVVGFANDGVYVALSSGSAFLPATRWIADFGSTAGYGVGDLRQLADVDGDGFPDIIGTHSGTNVARSDRNTPADLLTGITELGLTTSASYDALTNVGIYTKGSAARYPQIDLSPPLYVVSMSREPNALGSGYVLNYYQYGGLRVDLSGRGLLGFAWQTVLQADSNLSVRTDFRQDWPYVGLPVKIQRSFPGAGSGGLLNLVTNTYACTNPQDGAACNVTAGKSYFTHLDESTEAAWDVDGAAFPAKNTSRQYDPFGNVTKLIVASEDGYSRATTNSYSNDTTNWLLGRLLRSQTEQAAADSPAQGMFNGEFTFIREIASNTQNYDVNAAAIAAGWDQTMPLKATITINAGVLVSSSSTAAYAFTVGATPPGSTVRVINNGTIVGAGGNGAVTKNLTSTAAGAGGGGLLVKGPVIMTNSGTIAGGGGGGGGGGGVQISYSESNGTDRSVVALGGDGGRGQGSTPATAGLSGSVYSGSIYCCGSVTLTGGRGGNGGTYGMAGSAGSSGSKGSAPFGQVGGGTPGGAAGPAVNGNELITWLATGSRIGTVSNRIVPTISAVSPNTGPLAGGTLVAVSGANFVQGATLSFGGVAAVGCSVVSANLMTCLTPPSNAGAKAVTVGVGNSSATLANGFTYQTLSLSSISPAVDSFAGGASIAITGNGFADGLVVSIGGAGAIGCAVLSPTTATCRAPANTPGIKDVTVGLDETSATLPAAFTYQELSVTNIAPNQGAISGGTEFTMTGTGFTSDVAVKIDSVATACSVKSLTSMTCVSPVGNSLGAKDAVVTLGNDRVALTGGFTYVGSFAFAPNINANTQNYNLRSEAIRAGWNQSDALLAQITISAGVTVGSGSVALPAFETGSSFPGGSVLVLTNNGTIIGATGTKGADGVGGIGGASGKPGGKGGAGLVGGTGGTALRVLSALTVKNTGSISGGSGGTGGIGGGGGGGGGGTSSNVSGTANGGTGGKGAGSDGTNTAGKSGGLVGSSHEGTAEGGKGGNGGALGKSGAAGAAGYGYYGGVSPGTGGAPGATGAAGGRGVCVEGNANVTWAASGSRVGALQ
ncbi:MAG: IPT/TIG domain-containing protein [Propionivibrio sp.]